MAVYNAAPYLQETLDSLYKQSFTDFEIIVVNDGSKDDSYNILKSQTDKRLRIFDNGSNQGIIYSVNRGLEEVHGEYIARMDADDICYPERLKLQADFLDTHPDCDLVTGFIEMFDNNKNNLGEWAEDRQAIDNKSIRKTLPRQNCIAQSTVMFRSKLLKKYRYRKIKLNARYFAEDYYLWLLLAADGIRLEKINKPLVNYRVYIGSASNTCNNPDLTPKFLNPDFWFSIKDVTTKLIFTKDRISQGKFKCFEIRTLYYALKELLLIFPRKIKKWIKTIIKSSK